MCLLSMCFCSPRGFCSSGGTIKRFIWGRASPARAWLFKRFSAKPTPSRTVQIMKLTEWSPGTRGRWHACLLPFLTLCSSGRFYLCFWIKSGTRCGLSSGSNLFLVNDWKVRNLGLRWSPSSGNNGDWFMCHLCRFDLGVLVSLIVETLIQTLRREAYNRSNIYNEERGILRNILGWRQVWT